MSDNLRITEEHLLLFAAASLDFNPLHRSETYARTTSFGERVVYGVLGVLASLARVEPPAGKFIAKVSVDFRSALLLGIEYAIRIEPRGGDVVVADLIDGQTILVRTRLWFADGVPRKATFPDRAVAPRRSARFLADGELTLGLRFEGEYGPPEKAYLDLLRFIGLDRNKTGDGPIIALLCSSYLTGMELPGERAAYVGLEAEFFPAHVNAPITFQIGLQALDERLGRIQSRFELTSGREPFVRGEVISIARPLRSPVARPAPRSAISTGAAKTALVIGASRGLGAALALSLAASGYRVTGIYAQSDEDARAVLLAAEGLSGRLDLIRGDATDVAWCESVMERIGNAGALDLLVCSAAPSIHPLHVQSAFLERIQSYVQKGFALVSTPLCTFLGMVSQASGAVLLISSVVVQEPVPNWPHYVAMKSAVEGLVKSASLEYPTVSFWIARPNKVRTDLTDTPLGRLNAEDPAELAARLINRIVAETAIGGVRYC